MVNNYIDILLLCRDPVALNIDFVAVKKKRSSPAFGIISVEAAEDLDYVRLTGLSLALRKIETLEKQEVCLFLTTDGFKLFFKLLSFCIGFCKLLAVLSVMLKSILHIERSHIVKGRTVINGRSGCLRVKLKQDASESGLSAAGLADNADRLSLVNVKRNILVCADIELLALENGGLCYREVFLEVSY